MKLLPNNTYLQSKWLRTPLKLKYCIDFVYLLSGWCQEILVKSHKKTKQITTDMPPNHFSPIIKPWGIYYSKLQATVWSVPVNHRGNFVSTKTGLGPCGLKNFTIPSEMPVYQPWWLPIWLLGSWTASGVWKPPEDWKNVQSQRQKKGLGHSERSCAISESLIERKSFLKVQSSF